MGAPKADSLRTVNLAGPAVDALVEHLGRSRAGALPAAAVFTRSSGAPLRGWDVQRYWARARLAADLPAARVHDLRHAGLTLATQSGATLREVMRRAGHKSSDAALIYQHAAADRDAEVAARMASSAGPPRSVRAREDHFAADELRGHRADLG
ncbi:tyrosine-type recombinase/integrase [Sporichthya sp.]|uniref:tyrosine-type recombinase/integrase n=1 Tax=Sporichthya sp. TaxID=65475 RepID=UPI0025D58C55|nr:tyrosine-type recombinase/integrase [Sporichthya sp.]